MGLSENVEGSVELNQNILCIYRLSKRGNTEQELRSHMALVMKPEEPRAKSSDGMSSSKILRINGFI